MKKYKYSLFLEEPYKYRMKHCICSFILLCSIKLFAQPVINGFSPTSGAAGSIVSISGSNFSTVVADNIVYFGAVRANVTSATSSSLTVVVPKGATYQSISVTTNFLTAWSSTPFVLNFSGGGNIADNSFQYAVAVDSISDINGDEDNRGLAIGDFDGDGKPDFAIVDRANNILSVYKNNAIEDSIIFSSKVDYPTGNLPNFVTTADLDGDGRLDLIVTNSDYNSSSVSVYKNTSQNYVISFSAIQTFAAGTQPSALAITDFDKDGKADIAVANIETPGSVSILRNTTSNGTISFADRQSLSVNGSFNDVEAADFDGDGKMDLVFSNFTLNNVSVFRNTSSSGSITFENPKPYATGNFPSAVSTGDIDGDGKPDLAVTNFSSNSVSLLRNTSADGVISFTAKKDIGTLNSPNDVSMSDLDGDGKLDLLISDDNNINSAYSISVLKKISFPGNTTFIASIDYGSIAWDKVLAADFDTDGRPDLVASGSAFHGIIYRNRIGSPKITSYAPTSAGAGTTVTITGENFNGAMAVSFGGVPAESFTIVNTTTISAVVGEGASGNISITTPLGTGKLSGFTFASFPVITSFSPTIASTGNTITINGANFTNATSVSFGGIPAASYTVVSPSVITAVIGAGSSGNIVITFPEDTIMANAFLFSTGPIITSFSPISAKPGSLISITGSNFHLLADSNIVLFGAVKARVVKSSANVLSVEVPTGASYNLITVTVNGFTSYSKLPFSPTFISTGNLSATTFSSSLDYDIGSPSYCIGSCDWDSDGKIDIAITGFESKKVSLFRNTAKWGSVSFAPKIDSSINGYAKGIGVGDFDGNGSNDLAVLHFGISLFTNTSTPGAFSFSPKVDISSESSYNVAISDLNGDGKSDIVATNYSKFQVLQNSRKERSISFRNPVTYVTGSGEIYTPCLGDFDGDGKPDLAVVNSKNNSLSVLKNISILDTIKFASPLDFETGYKPWGMAIGDLDGDEKLDIVISNFESNTVSLYINTSSINQISFNSKLDLRVGNEPRCVALGDLNGDGKPDIVTVNAISNSISVLENKCANGMLSFGRIDYPTGSFPQYVSINDYDGDGKPDLAIANYSSKSVSILRNRIGEEIINMCNGKSFSLASSIAGTSFQWQINKGEGFVNLIENTTFSGSSTASLKISDVDSTFSGYQLRCKVDDSFSTVFTIVVQPTPAMPEITTPSNSLCSGNFATLISSSTSGNQWYRDGSELYGSTTKNLTTLLPGSFSVTTTINGCTSAPSIPVVLTSVPSVTPAISITSNGCSSGSVTFTSAVTNSGSGGTIQWFVNNELAGTGSTLTLNNISTNVQVFARLTSTASCAFPQIVNSDTKVINCVTTAITSIDELEMFEVAPNPTDGLLLIKLKVIRLSKVGFEVIDITGSKVFVSSPINMRGVIIKEINLRGRDNGLYFLKTNIGNKTIIKKIIVSR